VQGGIGDDFRRVERSTRLAVEEKDPECIDTTGFIGRPNHRTTKRGTELDVSIDDLEEIGTLQTISVRPHPNGIDPGTGNVVDRSE